MRLRQVLAGMEIPQPVWDPEITGISFDSRRLAPGNLFVALPGGRDDGRNYIGEAIRKGAAAVVTEAGVTVDETEGVPVLLVPDGRAALAGLSANWFGHPEKALRLVGITGTNGKTTVSTLLFGLLQLVTGRKCGLIGTNQIAVGEASFAAGRTTPESWEIQKWLRDMVDAGCQYAVMEVSSHALCLKRVDGLRFDVGAFTNLTQDHLDFHRSMEAYREAKRRLFCQCRTAVINVDDETGREFAAGCHCPVLRYSARSGGEAALQGEDIQLFSDRVAFTVSASSGRFPVRVPIPGLFTVSNALCVLGCCVSLDLPLCVCAGGLERLNGVRGRMEAVPVPGPGSVILDYAHTPDALEKVLIALREFTKGRLICLFGCGGDRDRTKRPLMGEIAARYSDLCVVTSDNPRTEEPMGIIADILAGMDRAVPAPLVEPDREKAIALALDLLEEGDVLLLAGKGHETYQETDGVRRHMDERELVLAKYSHL